MQSIDAERAFIGSCLISPPILDTYGQILRRDFVHPFHGAIYEALTTLRIQGRVIDPVTVWDEITSQSTGTPIGSSAELMEVAKAGTYTPAGFAAIVIRESLRRRLMQTASEIIERARTSDDVPGEVSGAIRGLSDLELGSSEGPRAIGDGLDNVIEGISKGREARAAETVRSGIVRFDELTGGFRPGQLIVVAARPGIGKTALAGSIAMRTSAGGTNVLVFSLEMTFQEMAERFLGAISRVSVHDISSGNVSDAKLKTIITHAKELARLPVWIDDRMNSSPQISSICRSWAARHRDARKLIIIDYLGLIRSSVMTETRALEVGKMALAAKASAKELGCPVILVSQLNRLSDKEGRSPILSDLRDSGEIEQHADMVIFPHRNKPLDTSGPASLVVAKHRGGPTGSADCYWNASLMLFEDARESYHHVLDMDWTGDDK